MPLIDSKSWMKDGSTHHAIILQGFNDPRFFVQYNIYQGGSSQGILNTPFKTLSGARKAFDKLN